MQMKNISMIQTMSHLQNSIEETKEGKLYKQWFFTVILNIAALNIGLQVGWPSAVSNVLQSEKSPTGVPLTTIDISWLASSPNLSGMLSVPIWTYLVDKYGRKPLLIVCELILTTSWIFKVFGTNFIMLMTSRIFGGIAGGGIILILPMYSKELSQDSIRGIMAMMWNIARSLGILIIYLMGGYIEYYIILWISLTVSIVSVLALLIPPESPSHYFKIGKRDIAAKTIASLRCLEVSDKPVQIAFASIKAEDDKFKSIPNIQFFGIFRQKAWRNGFIFMLSVMFCHGLNGGYAIANYAPQIMRMFRVTINPELQSTIIPIFMIVGCGLSMVFIEYLGRKVILALSFFLCFVAFIALSVIVLIQQNGGYVPGWVAMFVTVIAVCMYAAAVSPIPFVIMVEMFNFQIRAKMMGCLAIVGWGSVFVQILIFGLMSTAFGEHVTFLFYACINLFGVVVVLVLLPETKRKSVEEIEQELEKKFG